jgi:hypothetical protein
LNHLTVPSAMSFSCRDDPPGCTGAHPGLPRPPARKTWPRVLVAPAVRSSQVQVHVTNFDYNQHPVNTMPARG